MPQVDTELVLNFVKSRWPALQASGFEIVCDQDPMEISDMQSIITEIMR